jgi:hypothetical protein
MRCSNVNRKTSTVKMLKKKCRQAECRQIQMSTTTNVEFSIIIKNSDTAEQDSALTNSIILLIFTFSLILTLTLISHLLSSPSPSLLTLTLTSHPHPHFSPSPSLLTLTSHPHPHHHLTHIYWNFTWLIINKS